MSRKTHRPPAGEHRIHIDRLGHDGRGIGSIDGKTVFVEGALAGEDVQFRYTFTRKTFDEGYATQVLAASPSRIAPPCAHAAMCGGCSLQHLDSATQVALKQQVLAEQFRHFGAIEPREWVSPLTGESLGYRRKARLAVRYVEGKGGVLVGFREKRSHFIADLHACPVLLPAVGSRLDELRALLSSLAARARIPQVEVAAGDFVYVAAGDPVHAATGHASIALVIRHLDPLSAADEAAIIDWCRTRNFHCYLQPGNESTIHRAWPSREEAGPERLSYRLDDFNVELLFHPNDFTQVNADINRRMVARAIEWLDPQAGDRVLDLFCGLGNFTLPLATRAAHVTGVEGSEAMVARGQENVLHNRRRGLSLGETRFFAANLDGDFVGASWARESYDRLLIDPPRSGAEAVCRQAARFGVSSIVYVSCNPATLARDAGLLVEQGYVLEKAGVMDMFPHTTHVESMALFRKAGRVRR